ncbi:MAG: 1-acyl-sn-glycerol-3-phosphate acyltransferase [Bacteroidales bacterium]|nr:1-acyl-sn-glycerol-3-phosphate acyltransferase [Bacteroidales bacterium]
MAFSRKISGMVLRIAGWKVRGEKPKEKKYVFVAAPHTSNWDFPLARLTSSKMEIKLKLLMKKSWFVFPLNYIFNALGVIPIDRKKSGGFIDGIVEKFNTTDDFIFVIAPEGTRSYVESWKTGFYTIAVKAKVPIALAFVDYAKKETGIGPILYPSGDAQKDFEKIMKFYRTISPRFPEKFNLNPDFGK